MDEIPISPGEADAAFVRMAVEEASRDQAGWLYPLDAKDQNGHYRHPWHLLYARLCDAEGGLCVLRELQHLRDEIARLDTEVIRLQALTAGVPLYVRPSTLPME